NAGDRQGALAAAQEAVALYRALAKENPQAFTPNLAGSVSNLATFLSEAGDRQGALAAAQEAVALYRALAKENPQAFTPDLARTLSSYGDVLMASGQSKESIAAYQECAELLRPFMEAMPDTFAGLFNANLRDLIKALQANGAGDAEIGAALDALGVQLGGSEGQPPEVALFQAWAQAHNKGRTEDARTAYAQLISALDADLANPALDPIRDAVDQARAQLGEAWAYGDGPRRAK
ncbi:MAG: tetratricopeptide repeat protein, partial [Alphaproteobacteria bacterium]|nr:tetratricopeptide repeat protein [Alphaproteobacteria bacterium]